MGFGDTAADNRIDTGIGRLYPREIYRVNLKTLFLLIILVLLGVYLYELSEWRKSEHRIKRVFTFDLQKVEVIRLAKGGEPIILKKRDKEWEVSRSVESGTAIPLRDERIILNLLSVFDYGIIDIIDKNPANLADFGLDNPALEFGIKMKGDPSFKTLLIGNNNPTNNTCYAKVKTSPSVLLLGILYKVDLEAAFDLILSRCSQ